MAKSYQRRVCVRLSLDRRYARFIRAYESYSGERRQTLGGPRGVLAKWLRQVVDDLATDADLLEGLARSQALDLGDWSSEYAEAVLARAAYRDEISHVTE